MGAAVGAAVVAAGLASRGLPGAGPLGDVLYPVLVYCLVVFCGPAVRPWVAGCVAVAVSAAVEFFQLTGVPAWLGARLPAAHLVLGSAFAATDLAWYAVGAVAAATVHSALRGRPR